MAYARERGMTIITVSRAATTDEISAEMDRRGAVIERLEANVRHWREECGKLHARNAELVAALKISRPFVNNGEMDGEDEQP
jgi:hypothetical protein